MFQAAPLQRRFLWFLKSTFGQILLFGLPWCLVLLGLAVVVDSMVVARLSEPAIQAQSELVARGHQVLTRRLSSTVQDVRFLASLPDLQDVLNGDAHKVPAVTEVFRHFSSVVDKYNEIRWLDETGVERIRVDRGLDGPRTIPSGQLQDKSQRPTFRDTMQLAAGQIYFSRFDLSVENNRLELPIKPMLRIATPVFDRKGGRRGIVVLNFLGSDVLGWLAETAALTHASIELVDGEGFWLMSHDPANAWGFMLGHPQATLAHAQPDLWRAIRNADSGVVQLPSGVWGFRHFIPSTLEADRTHDKENALDWVIISHLDAEALAQRVWSAHLMVLIVTLLAIGISMYVVLCLVRFRQGRERSIADLLVRSSELATANSALQYSLDMQKNMQEELVRAEKLSSLGLMVAGVAHELNTPLGTAVMTLSSLEHASGALAECLQRGLRQSELREFLGAQQEGFAIMHAALERAAALVSRFKQLAVDRQTEERRQFRLREVIEDSLHVILRQHAGRLQQLVIDVPEALVMDSYPGPLGQIIDNLVRNAFFHAFVAERPGTVQVLARADESQERIILRVMDNGKGIPRDLAAHVFELFFTTRRGEGGAGLGLFLSHQLACEVLGGTLTLDTSFAPGSCFVLEVPRVAPQAKPRLEEAA
jgi:signal transduction histidine kinase